MLVDFSCVKLLVYALLFELVAVVFNIMNFRSVLFYNMGCFVLFLFT